MEDTAITQIAEVDIPSRGRPVRFTPERIQQIKNLLERGESREEIAELIGVTVGSLQVTCSRLGVSLRRPNVNTGTGLLRRDAAHSTAIAGQDPNGGDIVPPQPAKERPEEESRPAPVDQAQTPNNEAIAANFAIRIQYRGEERTTQLPLTQDMIRQLAFKAAFRNMSMGELIGEIIVAALKR